MDELHWQTLTTALSERRTPNSFVKDLVFSREVTHSTETLGIDAWVGGRRMAPMVLPGASAQFVPGMSKTRRIVTFPNIRIKRPFEAAEILFSRTPGSVIQLPVGGTQYSEVEQAIALDVAYMGDQIDDREEWMSCQALTGIITYTVSGSDNQPGDAFTIDYNRPAAHDETLSGSDLWDAGTPAEGPRELALRFQRLFNAAGMGGVKYAILGQEAAAAFEAHPMVRADLNILRMFPGAMALSTLYSEKGARYLGTVYGVEWWEYSRSVLDPFGNTVDLIGPTTAHFIAGGGDNTMEYGGIVDFKAFKGKALRSRRFSKVWEEEDPSTMLHLATARPLPVTRRPEAFASATVL